VGVEENLSQTEGPIEKNNLESHVQETGHVLPLELPSLGRRAQAAAAASVVGLVVLALAGGIVAAGLGLLALAGLAVAFLRPYLLGPFVALLLPFAETSHVLGAQVSPLEAVVGGGAIGYIAHVAKRRERVHLGMAAWTFAALLVFIALSTFGPVDNSDRLRELFFWGALGVVFYSITVQLSCRRYVRLLLIALAASTLFEASLALYEYVDRWSERVSLLGGVVVYPLPTGTLGHRNALGQFLVLSVLAVLALALADRGIVRRLGFVAVGAGSLALVVTLSRASWIAFAVGVSVYLLERRTRLPVLVAGGVAVAGAVILALLDAGAIGSRISSLFSAEAGSFYDFRLELVERGASSAAENPFTGSGHFEEVGIYAGTSDLATHPHNLLVGVAVFFGIPAALAFAGLVLFALRTAWMRFRTPADTQRLTALGILAVLVALLVNGLLEYPFWNTSLTALIVLVLAVALTLDRDSPEHV
jgi:O-Antigen ligase